MDKAITGAGTYDWLNFNNPISESTADELVRRLAWSDPVEILDVGCGWGEMLLRLLAACPQATGHGIDHDRALLERGEANAAHRSLNDRVRFSLDITAAEPADLVLNLGAEHVFGDLDDALEALWHLVRPGRLLLFSYQFWQQPPDPATEAMIGPLPTLAELVETAASKGWRPLGLTVASPEAWDQFEFGFLADWEQVVMAGSGGRDEAGPSAATEAKDAADEWRQAFMARRGALGAAFLTLGRPAGS